jgi:glycosyltransferase involved in cell wall biosynthesis
MLTVTADVHVLMSTYNGQSYLERQIGSILQQTVAVKLFVRDDGSTDDTPSLLETLSSAGRLEWERGPNLGVTGSFFRLLRKCSGNANYVAFSDQDDVWLSTKLGRAIAMLEGMAPSTPALYCSRATITDDQLNPIGLTPLWPRPPAFGNALVENIVSGCTIVLNRPAQHLLLSAPAPKGAIFHDWWCYLVVSSLGLVFFDPEPSILYRQHRNNAVGATVSRLGRTMRRIGRQFVRDSLGLILAQAEEFSRHYQSRLSTEFAEILSLLLAGRRSLMARERLLFDRRIFRQHAHDDALLRLRFAVGPWSTQQDAEMSATRRLETKRRFYSVI